MYTEKNDFVKIYKN